MLNLLLVFVGGGIGASTRYIVSNWAASRYGVDLPYGTLIVNVVGCLIIGAFMVIVTERVIASPYWRLLITVGFIGGLTTFSSFSYETFKLLESGNLLYAFYNVLLNLVIGFTATYLGMIGARLL